MSDKLIKSKKRVKEFGEVYTPDWLVEKMLDLIPDEEFGADKEFLEPACGNGNFLVAILKRKLKNIDRTKENELRCLMSLHGVDIQQDNVEECRKRLADICVNLDSYVARAILERNIVVGNTLEPETVIVWKWEKIGTNYGATPYLLSNLEEPMGRLQALSDMVDEIKVWDAIKNDC